MAVTNPKRVAVFVTAAFTRRKYLGAVSGHVQIPLMAANLLAAGGHKVTLITTRPPGADCLPSEASAQLEVCVVPHAARRWPEPGVHVGRAGWQLLVLWALLLRRRFDVVHFFGGANTGMLLGVLKAMGAPGTAFYTPIKRPPPPRPGWRTKLVRRAYRGLRHVCATSEYVAAGWRAWVDETDVGTLRPGVVKQLSPVVPASGRDSVLFWRNAGYRNGVDVAMKSFEALAGKYSDIRFVFAVRPHDEYEQALLTLAQQVDNIEVHIYPYRDGVTLASLLGRALFVVQPFRSLSVNPQMAILESLYAGVPVIATAVESNSEVVHHEENGLLIRPDDEAQLTAAIERLLGNGDLLGRLTQGARSITERQWNWDRFGEQLLQAYREQ